MLERMLGRTGAIRQRQAVHGLPVSDRGIAPPARFVLLDAQEIGATWEARRTATELRRAPHVRPALYRRLAAISSRDTLAPQRGRREDRVGPRDTWEPHRGEWVSTPRVAPPPGDRGRVLRQR